MASSSEGESEGGILPATESEGASVGGIPSESEGVSVGGIPSESEGASVGGIPSESEVASVGGILSEGASEGDDDSSISVGGLMLSDDDVEVNDNLPHAIDNLPDVDVRDVLADHTKRSLDDGTLRGRGTLAKSLRAHVVSIGSHRDRQRVLRKVELFERSGSAVQEAGHGLGAAWLLYYVLCTM